MDWDHDQAVEAAAHECAEVSTHGIEALHGLSPFEIVARMEDAGEEEGTGRRGEEETGRGSLFLRVTEAAVSGRPTLEVMGQRLWLIMRRHCAHLAPKTRAVERRMLEVVARQCNGRLHLGEVAYEECARVLGFIARNETTARGMGRRVSLLAFAGNKSPAVRAALPSMQVIGELWGLRAENKRSAISAALKKVREEMRESATMAGDAPQLAQFFFQKRAETVAKYRAAQKGNCNRHGGAHATDDEDAGRQSRQEVAELRLGIPVKVEFARMRPEQLKARLRALREEWEARRMAGL